jgi:putative DNA primase/helicase
MGYDTIEARQPELESFQEKVFSAKKKKSAPLNGKRFSSHADDQKIQDLAKTVLDRALKSKNREIIRALLNGENAGQSSDSEGDLVLCNHLVFFCGQIPDADVYHVVDFIIRNSNRMRPKWDKIHRPADGATYGQMTIETAMTGTTNRYKTHAERVLSDTQDVTAILDRIGKTMDDVINLAYDGQAGSRELFIDVYRGRLCFDHAAGTWHEFQGHAWKQENLQKAIDECSTIKRIFERADAELGGRIIDLGQDMKNAEGPADCSVIEAKVEQAEKQQKVVRDIIRKLNTLPFRKQVVEFASVGDNSLGITGDEWDRMPWHLPCQNGVLDLKTGILQDGKPDDYLKSVCPTSFDPGAERPVFLRSICDIFGGSDELISFMQRVFGLSLVGVNVEHKLFVLWGKGRNGKDTILKAIKNALGDDLAGEIRSEMLLDQGRIKSSSGPSADIMRLRGLRLTWACETNEGRRMDAGQVKLLTGGGDLVGRPPYGRREVSFPQSFTLCLLTNSKPQAPAEDYALWRRICLIPFNTRFVDDPQKPNEKLIDRFLDDKLVAEASGILSWLVQGCLDWQRDGLRPPDIVTQATSEYRADEDIIQQFIDDACIVHRDGSCKAGKLYKHYTAWMLENGMKPVSGTAFGRKMGERFEKSKSSNNRYSGIGIATTDEDDRGGLGVF